MLLPWSKVAKPQYYFFPHTPWITYGVCCLTHYVANGNRGRHIMMCFIVRADLNRFGQVLQHCICTLPSSNKPRSTS